MSITDRQNRLLVAEDWKRVYQSFRNAEFQSYDFDNLRRTMISYLRENYPEDFNDYIESSEYLALIDLIAFLGQNLSYRIDLNARENYLELAERRESVLRMARLLSYNPKRNQAANGLLKVVSVKTTEELIDSNGVNLRGQTVVWNDASNTNWLEQTVRIVNTCLPTINVFGRPVKLENIGGVPTSQYRVNGINTDAPIYNFQKPIEGQNTRFQLVSTTIENGNIVEEPPVPGNNFSFLYRDDGQGAGSSNTGFFMHFRQGILENGTFNITNPTPNQTVAIDTPNINNSDVWLFGLDSNGNENSLWTKVDSVEGNNIIYNSVNKGIRSVYAVQTRADDRINVVFSDGVFGELPSGNFRSYYRTSANRSMVIVPKAMQNVTIDIPYLSKNGQVETITFVLGLQYTVSNSATSESTLSIKTNAPSTYYTQNRLVTAEDYNLGPLGVSQEVIKTKSVNRVASGISRYFDLKDATGKYSTTNLYGNDGIVYKEDYTKKTSFSFSTQTDIEGVIVNQIQGLLSDVSTRNYYYEKFPEISTVDLEPQWNVSSEDTNTFKGYFTDLDGDAYNVGSFTANNLKFIEADALLKFESPTGYYFDKNNDLVELVNVVPQGGKTYIWTKVIQVVGTGADLQAINGTGGIVLSDKIPQIAPQSGTPGVYSILTRIIPPIVKSVIDDVKIQMIDQAFSYNEFGLRYDVNDRQWKVITNINLSKNDFSLGFTGDATGQNLDSSWLLLFETNGETYTITRRGMRYVFESDEEIKFYYDSSDKIYDNTTGKIVKDKISVLSINTIPGNANREALSLDYNWEIIKEYRDPDNYVDSTKIEVGFFDADSDGVVDNPEMFYDIVDEDNVTDSERYIFLEKYKTQAGTEDFRYVDNDNVGIVVQAQEPVVGQSSYDDGQVFYFYLDDYFLKYNKANNTLNIETGYKARIGRDKLKFHYVHAADSNSRIDPSASNIIDTYILSKNYDLQYRNWLKGATNTKPLPPSSDEMYRTYGQEINKIKSLSDEVIYHPVKYKVLFGAKANEDLQATFKVVKNSEVVLNNNDIKTRIIEAVNQFFALENWEFGDTFYFQELATYVMNYTAPDIVNFIIVPNQVAQSFGSLFEIKSESDEIFINGATVTDVEVIDEITASRLQASGNVVTQSSITNTTGILSSPSNNNTSSSGGFSY